VKQKNGIASIPREQTVDFQIKSAWHSINRMYNQQGLKYDLSTSTGFVLLNIDSKNGTPATKIAPLLGMEPRSLSRMLKSLEEKGLIYRKTDEKDKRFVKIYLTELGKEKKDIAKKTVKRFNQVIKNEIPEEKLRTFFEVLGNIQTIIESNHIFN
jgi:DNA-binding MarR family transcriptional regulator